MAGGHQRNAADHRAAALTFFEEGWNRGTFEGVRRVVAPTFTFHVHGTARAMNVADLEQIVASWRRGFPDLRFDLHEVLVDGAVVAVRSTLTSTNLGAWRGKALNGSPIAVDHMFFLRFDDGLLAEVWEVLDRAALDHQLDAAVRDS